MYLYVESRTLSGWSTAVHPCVMWSPGQSWLCVLKNFLDSFSPHAMMLFEPCDVRCCSDWAVKKGREA